MAAFRSLDDLDVAHKRVLVRLDLNVPMRDGRISDPTRIERAVPTLAELRAKGAKVVVLSHFGRPKGQPVAAMSLKAVVPTLAEALGCEVRFAEDCVGAAASGIVDALADGDVAVLENVRFHAGEENNDDDFAQALAASGDLYVNDAFSCAHRAHASTEGLAHKLPAAAGRAMQAELQALESALQSPKRPVTAIVGGAKVSTKLDVLGHLIERVDVLAIGGAMANTFLFAQDYEIGVSLCERDMADTARKIMAEAEAKDCEILLPRDVLVAKALKPGVDVATVVIEHVPADMMILDIGPRAALKLEDRLSASKTLLWNGPMGAFETPPFDEGTRRVAEMAARLTREGRLVSVAGGGDTVAALVQAGVIDDLSYVSTAGGAFLEWLEGKVLPGVAALTP